MSKKSKNILIIVFVFALFILSVLFSIIEKEKYSNLFTIISGWISGVSTIILGLIAIFQNKYYKNIQEYIESRIDVIVENIIKSSESIEKNHMYRICDSEEIKCCMDCFIIRVFNYLENPILDIKIKQMVCPDKQIITYKNQPINKDQFGRSVLVKNNFINFSVPLPNNYSEGEYQFEFYMQNMNGELFKKYVSICIARNITPNQCYNLKQSHSLKID